MKERPWVWCDGDPLKAGVRVRLDRGEALHLRGPLRRRVGDGIALTDGAGNVASGVIVSLSGNRAEVDIEHADFVPGPYSERVDLALGCLHSQAMDWALQKAVEVGVDEFVPVVTARSQMSRRTVEGRLGRWAKLVREACKQCRRPWVMDLAEPCDLAQLFERWHDGGAQVADQTGISVDDLAPAGPFRLLVGPEGGFDEAENRAIAELGWPRLRLGPNVLRAETAVVVGAAFLVAARCRE